MEQRCSVITNFFYFWKLCFAYVCWINSDRCLKWNIWIILEAELHQNNLKKPRHVQLWSFWFSYIIRISPTQTEVVLYCLNNKWMKEQPGLSEREFVTWKLTGAVLPGAVNLEDWKSSMLNFQTHFLYIVFELICILEHPLCTLKKETKFFQSRP